MWTEFDAQRIYEAIDDWPGKIGEKAWADWSAELSRFDQATVQKAIRHLRKTQEKNTRPSLRALIEACGYLCGEIHRSKHGDRCPWCEGRVMLVVTYWALERDEADSLLRPLPAAMRRDLPSGLVAIDPRCAEQVGAARRTKQIQCGRCYTGLRWDTAVHCSEQLGSFAQFDSWTDREVYARCLQDQAPAPIERYSRSIEGLVVL